MKCFNRTRNACMVATATTLTTIGLLTAACGDMGAPAPSTTNTNSPVPSTSSSSAQPTATEKSINPTAGNLFSPQVKAPPAPAEPPGVHRNN